MRAALGACQETEFDAIFSDVRMPGVDGIQFLELLRRELPHLSARTGFVTGDGVGMDQPEDWTGPVTPMISKPVSSDDLVTFVLRLMEVPQLTRPDIILCDDEDELREVIPEYLATRGFEVRQTNSADAMTRLVDERKPDAIVLDVRMPGEDGLSALLQLRAASDIPVIMPTVVDDLIDRVVGLDPGADDYLGKPMDPREIEARIPTVLRHTRTQPTSTATVDDLSGRRAAFGKCELDVDAAMLFGPDGTEIQITAMEFSLLNCFVQNSGRVLNRDQLLDQAHNRDGDPFDRSIDLRVSRLRKKIEPNPAKPQLIKTVRGIGYVFDPNGN